MSVHQTLGEFLAEIDERVEIEGSELVESIGRRFWINTKQDFTLNPWTRW